MASNKANGDRPKYTVRQLRFRDFRFDVHLVPLSLHDIELTLALPEPHGSRGSRTVVLSNSLEQVVVSVSPGGFGLEVSQIERDY